MRKKRQRNKSDIWRYSSDELRLYAYFLSVAVKAKPECCSEQNRNGAREPVKRASARDFASKMAIVES